MIEFSLLFTLLRSVFVDKFFDYIEKHAKAVIALVALFTLLFAFFALKLNINADYEVFMPWGDGEDSYIVGEDLKIKDNTVSIKDVENSKSEIESLIEYQNIDKYKNIEFEIGSGLEGGSVEFVGVEEENEDFAHPSNYIIMLEAENLYTKDNLNTIMMCIDRIAAESEISAPSSVLDFVTFEKKGTRLATVPISPNLDGDAWTDEEAKILEARIKNDPIIKYYLVGEDGNSIMFQFASSSFDAARADELSAMLDPVRERGIDVYVNGGSVITVKILGYLSHDLITLVGLCLLMILVVYYLSFKSKRSVLIPMSMSLIGLVWTFGIMGMIGLDLTILNIVTPCMVITLGSAYSIHVLSEYYASFNKSSNKSSAKSISSIIRTIVFACLTTICGFLCLCFSDVKGLVEFGIAVSIGVFLCALLSCIYLPAVLSLVAPPQQKQIKSYKSGLMAKFIDRLSVVIIKFWALFLILFVVLFIAFVLVKDKIPMDSDYMSYFPDSDPFGVETKYFAETIGGITPFTITIEAPTSEKGYYLQKDNLEKVWEFENALRYSPDVLQVISFPSYVSFANGIMNGKEGIPETQGLVTMLSRLVQLIQNQTGMSLSSIMNEEGTKVSLVCQCWDSKENALNTTASIARFYAQVLDSLPILPDGSKVTISGSPVVSLKFSNMLFNDQNRSTILSIIIVFLLCSISFKSASRGFMTIVPVAAGVMINYVFMYLANIPFDLITVTFTSIAIGCGVDDAIHFMLRFKKNCNKGGASFDYLDAIRMTIIETGRPIILSTVSIVAGMMMLSFASFMPIRYFGLLMSVSLFGCMASTLVFMPPVMIFYHKISKALAKKEKKEQVC